MFQARSFASSEGEGLGGLEAPAPAPGPSGGGCCGCFGGARGAADGAAEKPAPAFDYDDYLLLEYKWDGPKELTPIEEELETEWVLGQTLRAGKGENACFVCFRRGGEAEKAVVKVVGIQGITETERKRQRNRVLRRIAKRSTQRAHILLRPSYIYSGRSQVSIVMPFVPQGSLSDLLAKARTLSEKLAREIVHQICNGLATLHRAGFIHQNLKLTNILWFGPKVKKVALTDYWLVDDASPRAAEGWAPPPSQPAFDMVAVGCCVYEMLSGEPPFAVGGLQRPQHPGVHFGASWKALSLNAIDVASKLLDADGAKRPTAGYLLSHPWFQSEDVVASGAAFSALGDLGQATHVEDSNFKWPMIRSQALQLAASGTFSALVSAEGELFSWGRQDSGALGNGYRRAMVPRPVRLGGLKVQQVALGEAHMVVLTFDGLIYAAGENAHGQLGTGSFVPADALAKAKTDDAHAYTQISAGAAHTAAVTSAGLLFTWGCNHQGRLGVGDEEDRSAPTRADVALAGAAGVKAVACGGFHTLAVGAGGELLAAGSNFAGQCGLKRAEGATAFRAVPISHQPRVAFVAAGFQHSLVLSTTGKALATGLNSEGQLGMGDTRNRREVELVPSLQKLAVVQASAGAEFSAAVTYTGEVLVAGEGSKGQLGLPDDQARTSFTPVRELKDQEAALVACGSEHALCVVRQGALYSWGSLRPPELLGHAEEANPVVAPSGWTMPAAVQTPPDVRLPKGAGGGAAASLSLSLAFA